MKTVILRTVIGLSLAYSAGVAVLANVPAWDELGGLPVSVAAVGCPSGPTALEYANDVYVPLVLAQQYDRGYESPASSESCRRIVEVVRASEPAYDYVPERFICRSVRAHARELWVDADIWVDSWLWIIDDHAVGAGSPDFVETLTAAGLGYEIDDRGRPYVVRMGGARVAQLPGTDAPAP